MCNGPVYCNNCGHRMITGVYSYDRKNRKKARLCTNCGRLVRFLLMSDGKQLPVPIWPGRVMLMRKII
jgi:hypothetical protein